MIIHLMEVWQDITCLNLLPVLGKTLQGRFPELVTLVNSQLDGGINPTPVLRALKRNTNLRSEPTTNSKSKVLYVANTTVFVLQPSVAKANGLTWDKVRIRVNGQEGYMINSNYK